MFHRTPRLFLRPPFPEDRDAILAAVGAAPPVCGSIIQGSYASGMRPFARQFLVALPDAAGVPVVGVASLLERSGALEIRLVIGENFRGRGFGAEAMNGLLQIAHALGFERVTAAHCAGDDAADRLLERSGFYPTGALVENDDCCSDRRATLYQWVKPYAEPLVAA